MAWIIAAGGVYMEDVCLEARWKVKFVCEEAVLGGYHGTKEAHMLPALMNRQRNQSRNEMTYNAKVTTILFQRKQVNMCPLALEGLLRHCSPLLNFVLKP
jgi:hypothetical protein